MGILYAKVGGSWEAISGGGSSGGGDIFRAQTAAAVNLISGDTGVVPGNVIVNTGTLWVTATPNGWRYTGPQATAMLTHGCRVTGMATGNVIAVRVLVNGVNVAQQQGWYSAAGAVCLTVSTPWLLNTNDVVLYQMYSSVALTNGLNVADTTFQAAMTVPP